MEGVTSHRKPRFHPDEALKDQSSTCGLPHPALHHFCKSGVLWAGPAAAVTFIEIANYLIRLNVHYPIDRIETKGHMWLEIEWITVDKNISWGARLHRNDAV